MTGSPDVKRSRRESGAFEIGDDLAFQRRVWTAERIGWVVIALVLLAGGLGLLGSAGPLNRVTADDGGMLRVEYARFARHSAPTELQMTLGPSATTQELVRIAVSREYLEAVEVARLLPEPSDVELTAEEFVYVFPVAEQGKPLTITFALEPEEYWRHRGTVRLPGGEAVRITQFIYP